MLAVDTRYDVFLSYDHADTDAVEELANTITVEFDSAYALTGGCAFAERVGNKKSQED